MTVSLQELFDAGAHLGHQAPKWHPRMKPWIYGEQDGIHIFDLEKTLSQLELARERLAALKKEGKSVIVVATKKQASEIVAALAEETGVMYVVNRWPGGLITNWDQVRKSIKRLNEIAEGLAGGEKYRDYTKYERLLLEKQLNRLQRLFGGVKNLKNKPDALFVVDAMKEKNAVHEALKEGVEVLALIDSNTDPTGISLPVPANDDALSSIKLIVAEILGAARPASVVPVAKSEPTIAPETEAASEPEVTEAPAVEPEPVAVAPESPPPAPKSPPKPSPQRAAAKTEPKATPKTKKTPATTKKSTGKKVIKVKKETS